MKEPLKCNCGHPHRSSTIGEDLGCDQCSCDNFLAPLVPVPAHERSKPKKKKATPRTLKRIASDMVKAAEKLEAAQAEVDALQKELAGAR